jgi:nucleotide-binding universal stress UspA family protein
MTQLNRILIAADGSRAARRAVELGIEVAAACSADVTVVHVVPRGDWDRIRRAVGRTGVGRTGAGRVAPEDVAQTLGEAADAAEAAGVSYSVEWISGEAADEIVAFAEAKDAELIVVGAAGRELTASTTLGSVCLAVLRRSRGPVLVVKG